MIPPREPIDGKEKVEGEVATRAGDEVQRVDLGILNCWGRTLPMIAIDNLSVRAGSFAFEGLSFTIPTGAYAVLMGKTGSGKTTLLEALCGLKPIRSGRITLLGREVTHLPPAQRGVGYVPQDLALFPTLSVREHLAFALVVRQWNAPDIERRVDELAALLGLRHLLDRWPQGLSGGESQRVALGRALAYQPRILLLDEPLSSLDDETREEMITLLRSVQQLTGVTTLHVTHSLTEARKLADRILVIDNGRIRELPAQNETEDVRVWQKETFRESPP
jgi:ABC-type sugar transport system ATPase subunit